MEIEYPATLFDKEGFIFRRNSEHEYEISFQMVNNNIQISKMIDFGLMKLIYDLNPDIYLKSTIDRISENEANVILVLKHFFEDLGMPQKYSFVNMKRIVEENRVIFESKSVRTHRPENIPPNAELLTLNNLVCMCDIVTPHIINFSFHIYFNEKRIVPPMFVQKLIGVLLNKIFKRVKQFIENLRV